MIVGLIIYSGFAAVAFAVLGYSCFYSEEDEDD